MCLERDWVIGILLVVDTLMAGDATINSRNLLERLIVVEIRQQDLLHLFRGVQHVHYGSVSNRRDKKAWVQRVQLGFGPIVIRDEILFAFTGFFAFADIFFKVRFGSSDLGCQILALFRKTVHLVLTIVKHFGRSIRFGLLLRILIGCGHRFVQVVLFSTVLCLGVLVERVDTHECGLQ